MATTMIEERAVVKGIDGNIIKLEGYQKPSCGGCVQKTSCGTSVLSHFMGNREVELVIRSDLPLNLGDEVLIGVEESTMLGGAAAVYILPLLMFFLFGIAGEMVAEVIFAKESELLSLLFAVAGFIASFLLVRKVFLFKKSGTLLNPTIIRKL